MTLKNLFDSLQKSNYAKFVGRTGYFDEVLWSPAMALEDEEGRIGITVPIKTVKTGAGYANNGQKHVTYGMITLFQRYAEDKDFIVECNSHKANFSTRHDYVRVMGEGGFRGKNAEYVCAAFGDLLDGKSVEGKAEGYFSWVTTMLTDAELANIRAKQDERKQKIKTMSQDEFGKYCDDLDQAEQDELAKL